MPTACRRRAESVQTACRERERACRERAESAPRTVRSPERTPSTESAPRCGGSGGGGAGGRGGEGESAGKRLLGHYDRETAGEQGLEAIMEEVVSGGERARAGGAVRKRMEVYVRVTVRI